MTAIEMMQHIRLANLAEMLAWLQKLEEKNPTGFSDLGKIIARNKTKRERAT